jgi:hypothetical protein
VGQVAKPAKKRQTGDLPTFLPQAPKEWGQDPQNLKAKGPVPILLGLLRSLLPMLYRLGLILIAALLVFGCAGDEKGVNKDKEKPQSVAK